MRPETLVPLMPKVAEFLWGSPNRHLSTKQELRYGKQGSKSVKLASGTWYDHEAKEGGGVLDLIRLEVHCSGSEAVNWLIENGFEVPGAEISNGGQRPNGAHRPETRPEPRQVARPEPEPEEEPQTAASGLPRGVPADARLAKVYRYEDETGRLLFEVCRFEYQENGQRKKTFRQRRPAGDGQWIWSVKGVRQVPYRIAEVMEAVAHNLVVFICEGEKDADNLASAGIPATCNAMGAGKWPEELVPFFEGADVVIIRDNDEAGQKHGELVASALLEAAASIRILDIPGLPPKGDVSDWLEQGNEPSALYDMVDKHARRFDANSGFRSQFGAVPWNHLNDPGPEHEWLIKGLLVRGERSMCAGASQAGKSFLILDLALSVARGIEFFGMKTLHGGVIYQAGEGGRGLKKRLRAYSLFHGIKADADLPFVLLPTPVDLYGGDDHTEKLIIEIQHWSKTFKVPLELVVIDTLSAATPGANENHSEDMSVVLARCARIAEAVKAHVMLVHHMNAGGEKPRGHTSIFANLDSVITITKVEGMTDGDGRPVREAKVTKQKDGEDGKSIRFVLRREIIAQDADGDDISSCVVIPPLRIGGVEVESRHAQPRLTAQCETFLRAIHRAIAEFGEPPPPMLPLPRGVRVVRWDKARDVFETMTFEADGETDHVKRQGAIRKAMQRHGAVLLGRGIIGRASPYIWLTGKEVRGFRTPDEARTPAEEPKDGWLDDLPA